MGRESLQGAGENASQAQFAILEKNKRTCNRVTLPTGMTPGFGVHLPCRVISAL